MSATVVSSFTMISIFLPQPRRRAAACRVHVEANAGDRLLADRRKPARHRVHQTDLDDVLRPGIMGSAE